MRRPARYIVKKLGPNAWYVFDTALGYASAPMPLRDARAYARRLNAER